MMSYYKKELNLKLSNFPNSNKLWETTISLPIYDQLKKSEINYICKMLIKFIKYDQGYISIPNEADGKLKGWSIRFHGHAAKSAS